MPRPRSAIRALIALAAVALPLAAQRPGADLPPRPQLPTGADTNDAQAYFAYGEAAGRAWDRRYAAYYWAHRLEPANLQYRHVLWLATWRRQSSLWREDYQLGDRKAVESPAARLLDSLYREVLIRDPFYGLEADTLCDAPKAVHTIRNPLRAGWAYFESGCLAAAADKWGHALDVYQGLHPLRVVRARVLYTLGRYAAAVSDLKAATDAVRRYQQKHLVYAYNTLEMFEYMTGLAQRAAGNVPAAREAFQRAVAEDLSFYMAHVRLAELAMLQGDTATAQTEYGMAAQLAERDGTVHFQYGNALLMMGRSAEAEPALRRAVELEPHHADGYFTLATLLDQQGKRNEARAVYVQYVARAPRRHGAQLTQAAERLAQLSAGR